MIRTLALLSAAAVASAANAGTSVDVAIDPSSAPWLGFMNVFELPSNGGGFVFGSPWGVSDLVANFDDGANTVTMSPNTVGDPDPFWYQGGGGPGAPGNKIMEANLYQQSDGGLAGTTVNFSGNVQSFSMTAAHEVQVFIRDFAADFSSSVDVFAAIDSTGAFSISLDTINDAARHVQWGIQVRGENVWVTDVAPFGNVVFSTVPTPASIAMMGAGGLLMSRRRRNG
jgi:hypothetical protein|tara:strand:- start:28089 stop:28769 length:681 start_codon:yes stop_codon:yes gene_type:complete